MDLDTTAYNLYPRLKPGATIPAEPSPHGSRGVQYRASPVDRGPPTNNLNPGLQPVATIPAEPSPQRQRGPPSPPLKRGATLPARAYGSRYYAPSPLPPVEIEGCNARRASPPLKWGATIPGRAYGSRYYGL